MLLIILITLICNVKGWDLRRIAKSLFDRNEKTIEKDYFINKNEMYSMEIQCFGHTRKGLHWTGKYEMKCVNKNES